MSEDWGAYVEETKRRFADHYGRHPDRVTHEILSVIEDQGSFISVLGPPYRCSKCGRMRQVIGRCMCGGIGRGTSR